MEKSNKKIKWKRQKKKKRQVSKRSLRLSASNMGEMGTFPLNGTKRKKKRKESHANHLE